MWRAESSRAPGHPAPACLALEAGEHDDVAPLGAPHRHRSLLPRREVQAPLQGGRGTRTGMG